MSTIATATEYPITPRAVKRTLAYLPLMALLAAMSVVPLIVLFLTSVVPEGSLPQDVTSAFTFDHYIEVFGDPWTYRLLANTFLYAGGVLLFSVAIAITMAWLVERTNMPLRDYAYIAIFLPMAMPGFISAIGWTFLLNPTNGVLNVWMRDLFGLETDDGPLNIYSLGGMIMVTGLALGPTMFIMLSSVMRNLDPSLEDSAYTSGASHAQVMRRVVIPLLRPGLLSIFIYFFVTAIEMLEIPLVFGVNAGYDVLSVTIFQKTAGGEMDMPNYGLSSTYAIIGLVVGLLLLAIYFRLMRQADRFAVITGKGYRPKIYKLGPIAKFMALGFFGLFIVLKLILPLAVLVWSSALPYFQVPSWEAVGSLTFKNYIQLFEMNRFVEAVVNTLVMMSTASLVCMGLAALVAWVVVRGSDAFTKAIDLLAFLPHLLPGLVIALALLLTSVGTPLYGTLTIIIVGNIIRYLPFGVRIMTAVMYQVAEELEHAAYTSGASRIATFRRIILPLVMPAFVNGLIWVGSHAMKDLILPLFLVSTANIVIGGLLWETWGRGASEITAVISVLLVAVLLCLVTPLQLALRHRVRRLDAVYGEGL